MIDQQRIISAAAKELGAVISSANKLDISYGHECWRIETSTAKKYLLKIPVRRASLYDFNNEIRAQQLLAQGGIPIPSLVAVCPLPNDLDTAFFLQIWLPGEDGASALPGFSTTEAQAFAWSFGQIVARMHSITGAAFSEDVLVERSYESWEDLCEARLTRLLTSNRRIAQLPQTVLDVIEERSRNLLAALPPDIEPRFTHRDLYLPNTLVRQNRFCALLDFEAARFYDPLWDFVKLDAWVFQAHPQLRKHFLEGYTSEFPWRADAAERIFLYQAIEYLAAFPYFGERFPNLAMLKSFHSLIAAWMASDPDHLRNWEVCS